jgi:hypothetical protein
VDFEKMRKQVESSAMVEKDCENDFACVALNFNTFLTWQQKMVASQ